MHIFWYPEAYEDYIAWCASDEKTCNRIKRFIEEITVFGPLTGTGKPERLRGDLSGVYSRRINRKDRLLYRIVNDRLEIIACRSHYNDT